MPTMSTPQRTTRVSPRSSDERPDLERQAVAARSEALADEADHRQAERRLERKRGGAGTEGRSSVLLSRCRGTASVSSSAASPAGDGARGTARPRSAVAARGIAEHAARAHVGQRGTGRSRARSARTPSDGVPTSSGAAASMADVSAWPAWPIEPRSTGKSSLEAAGRRRAPSSSTYGTSSSTASALSRPRLPPCPLTSTTVAEPRAQAARRSPGSARAGARRAERHGDAEAEVVRAEARPDGRRDEHVRSRERGRAQADRLDEQRVGADRQVLAVLLERADGDEADRARAAALAASCPGELAEPMGVPAIGLSTSASRR